ncbi:hypothetical protein AB0N89_19985 [Amycolatopsis sp. NPDC089917]|uniref:hypothetical protein n=1 Tax=Amycolatopsis sp. NPDC089917 TaxID=3155187 RepID=UPI00341359A7
MHGTQIRFQALVWTFGAREFAALLMDGHSPHRPDALLHAAQSRGLPLTTDVRRVPSAPVPGWRIEATSLESDRGRQTRLTVQWPRVRPLVSHADVDLSQRWQQLAVTHRVGLLLIGRDLVGDRNLPARVTRLAESGALAAGIVAFRSGSAFRPRTRFLHERGLERRRPVGR